MANDREGLQTELGKTFGERFKVSGVLDSDGAEGPLGELAPMHADEVREISSLAARYGRPVVAAGGGTSPESPGYPPGAVVLSLGLMKSIRLRHNGGGWAEAEPGALWLALDNELRQRGKGLAVYPTSAPRATVGGWLATDGLGVGSFEHGWLRENVLAADVVLPGGELRRVPGGEVSRYVSSSDPSGIVVSARLRTRRADTDRPFAIAFEEREPLLATLSELSLDPSSVPLWHAGFLSPGMARLRGLPPKYLLFGAYPGHRAAELEEVFWPAVATNGGEALGASDAYRVWGERFAPITPSSPAPQARREFTSIKRLLSPTEPAVLEGAGVLAQGTLSRGGEVLILTLEDSETRVQGAGASRAR